MSASQNEESIEPPKTVHPAQPLNVEGSDETSLSFAGEDVRIWLPGVKDDTAYEGAQHPQSPSDVGEAELARLSLEKYSPQSEDVEGGTGAKDAVQLLSQREIKRLQSVRDALTVERDDLQTKAAHATKDRDAAMSHARHLERQIRAQTASIDALTRKVQHLRHQLNQWKDDQLRWRSLPNRERILLLEQIEAQKHQIEIWKASAVERNSVAVSLAWQSSVDEAIRKEREKDAWIVDSLRREIKDLKSKAL